MSAYEADAGSKRDRPHSEAYYEDPIEYLCQKNFWGRADIDVEVKAKVIYEESGSGTVV